MLRRHGKVTPAEICRASLYGVDKQDRPVFEAKVPQYMVMMFGMRDPEGFYYADIASLQKTRARARKKLEDFLEEEPKPLTSKIIYIADRNGSIINEPAA